MIKTSIGEKTDIQFYNDIRKLHLALLNIEEKLNIYRDHQETKQLIIDTLNLNSNILDFYKSKTNKEFTY